MKKILSLVLLFALVALMLVGCGNKNNNDDPTPEAKTYTLSVVVDEGLKTVSRGGASALALALVYDADGKIVAARFDEVQPKFALNEDGTDIVATARFDTKRELGEAYGMVAYGGAIAEWDKQAEAFEAFLVGKTAAEVAALDVSEDNVKDGKLVAGCTMYQSVPAFKALVAKAFAYGRNVTFTTTETITLGLAIDAAVSGSVEKGGKIAVDVAAVAVAGGKVVASMLDSAEGKYTLTIGDKNGAPALEVALSEYKGTKNEQGDAYDAWQPMAAGRWYAQAQAYANSTVGKTVAELNDIATEGVAGCTIYTGGYKAALVRAAGNAR
nr:hypothetical protein [Clostridia bacterium]